MAINTLGTTRRYQVPRSVAKEAKLGLALMKNGFHGGTQTGWDRARQLNTQDSVDNGTMRTMRAWFARHGPSAKNGGTSYPGYLRWVALGKPMRLGDGFGANDFRGAVAWLIWGGDPAWKWVQKYNDE